MYVRKRWTSKIDKISFSYGCMRQPLLTSEKTEEARISLGQLHKTTCKSMKSDTTL